MPLREVFPDRRELTPEEAYADLELSERAGPDRPYVVANFVASLDGRASLTGESAPLSNPADRALFHELRAQADAILVGTGTLRVERYGRLAKNAELRAKRERAGLRADPLGVVISRSLDVPFDIPLFQDPDSTVVLYTAEDGEVPPTPARVEVRRCAPIDLRPGNVLAALRQEFGVRSVVCEGGPRLFAAVIADGALDELFLCLAPWLAGGGDAPTITVGPELPAPASLELVTAFEFEHALFLRYRVSS